MTTETTALQITEYSPIDAALSELRARYAGVIFPVETKEGMTDAKDVKRKLTKLRTGLEALRVDIKAPALKRTQAIDAEAKAITVAIKAIEDPIAAQIKAEEDRIEAEQEAKAAAERDRVAEIKAKIDGIRNLPLALAGESAEVIDAELQALAGFEPVEAAFAELTVECAQARHEAMGAMRELLERVQAQEAAAAAVAIERERLAEVERAANEKLAAERKLLAEERAEIQAGIDKERAEMAAERAAMAAERAALEAAKVIEVVTASVPVAVAEAIEAHPEVAVAALQRGLDEVSQPSAPITDFHVRRAALATADQFHALAGKAYACGAHDFATDLQAASDALREGQFDAALAGADFELLVSFDNAMLDATVACIDAMSEATEVAA